MPVIAILKSNNSIEIRDIRGKILCKQLYLGSLQVVNFFIVAQNELILNVGNQHLHFMDLESVL